MYREAHGCTQLHARSADQYRHKLSTSHLCCSKHHTLSSAGHRPSCWDADLLINFLDEIERGDWKNEKVKNDFKCSRIEPCSWETGPLTFLRAMIASHSAMSVPCKRDWQDELQTWLVGDSSFGYWLQVSTGDYSLSPHLVLVWPSVRRQGRETKVFKRQILSRLFRLKSFLFSFTYLLLTAVVFLISLNYCSPKVVKVDCSSPGCVLSSNGASSGCIWSRNSLWPCANKQVICQTPKSLLCGASLNLHVLREPFSMN